MGTSPFSHGQTTIFDGWKPPSPGCRLRYRRCRVTSPTLRPSKSPGDASCTKLRRGGTHQVPYIPFIKYVYVYYNIYILIYVYVYVYIHIIIIIHIFVIFFINQKMMRMRMMMMMMVVVVICCVYHSIIIHQIVVYDISNRDLVSRWNSHRPNMKHPHSMVNNIGFLFPTYPSFLGWFLGAV